MTIRLHKLMASGFNKPPALLDFKGESHLLFGPTDTGKSYIIQCIRYCLGASSRPKDIGVSEGYNTMALQVTVDSNEKYTLFRSLTDGSALVVPGFIEGAPTVDVSPEGDEISQLIVTWANGSDRKILTKSGTLGNLTANDLRRVSIFDEIETLNNIPFEGNDTNLKVRNRSSLALILSGTDDSNIKLPTSTAKRNEAKGTVDALTNEIASIKSELPDDLSKIDAIEARDKVSTEIDRINTFMQIHKKEMQFLKEEQSSIEDNLRSLKLKSTALSEARNSFILLNEKYESDLQRLEAISTVAAIVPKYEKRPCPLCQADIQHQSRHSEENANILRQAVIAEREKVASLKEGLARALEDVAETIDQIHEDNSLMLQRAKHNLEKQQYLISPELPNLKNGLTIYVDRKMMLEIAIKDYDRLDRLENNLAKAKETSKRKKQAIERDLASSSTKLCNRIKDLLSDWKVPGVDSVHFDENVADIEINHRQRISFGKGKRGIFLTAYQVALMEHALQSGNPHLGILVIDSPVVTYKDPKYFDESKEELLPVLVKDRFYAWLADRSGAGQIVILENEEPRIDIINRLHTTEFVGPGNVEGRYGFYPS